MSDAQQVFRSFARAIAPRAPLDAMLLERCADESRILALVPEQPSWDVPHRVLASIRWLVLGNEAEDFALAACPWSAFRSLLARHEEHVGRWAREQPVQTNDPQRSWALLPLFLTVARAARRPLALLELGTAAGLNLVWDRFRLVYRTAAWGPADAPLALSGDERRAVPPELLATRVEISSRTGVDLHPLDVREPETIRLLRSFDPTEAYARRLAGAAAAVAEAPPELVQGDYVRLLPDLLARRDDDALTIVFQTHSTVYLDDAGRAAVRAAVDAAGAAGPLAWISTPTPGEHGDTGGDYPLELAVWPPGTRRLVARTNVRGEWLEWFG